MDLGVQCIRRETLASSVEVAEMVLRGLGLPPVQATRLVKTFRDHYDKRLLVCHANHTDEERLRYLAMEQARELEEIFAQDLEDAALND